MEFCEREGERRGTKVYWAGENGFIKDYIYKGELRVKCKYSKLLKCKGRGYIRNGLLFPLDEHKCQTLSTDMEVISAKTTMKRKAEDTSEDLRKIFSDVVNQNPEVVSDQISFHGIVSGLRKRRKMNEPVNPKSPTEAISMLDDSTSHPYSSIYKGSVKVGKHYAILLGDDKALSKAKFGKLAFVDATFSMVPKLHTVPNTEETGKFYQLLIISVEYKACLEDPIPEEEMVLIDPQDPRLWGISIPIFSALMTSKTQVLYEAVFARFAKLAPEFIPAELMSDFEMGLQNGLRKEWKISQVRGCQFHFSHAIGKNVNALGLKRDYAKNLCVRKWIRKVQGLAMLPAKDVPLAWKNRVVELSQFTGALKTRLLAFKKYFENYWMKKITPERFSVFGLNHKTNNNAEALNRRLKDKMGDRHRSLWAFMSGYKEHVVDYTNRELRNMSNNVNPRRDTKYYATIAKIQAYEASLTAGEIDAEVFLGCVSTIFKSLPTENANAESELDDIKKKVSHLHKTNQRNLPYHLLLASFAWLDLGKLAFSHANICKPACSASQIIKRKKPILSVPPVLWQFNLFSNL